MKIFSKIISFIFQPIFAGLYCCLIMLATTTHFDSYNAMGKTVFFSIIAGFTIILPMLIILIAYRLGKISDLGMTERSQRTPIYLATITSNLLAIFLIFRVVQDYIFAYFMVFALFSVALITFINLFWKISSHTCGMGIISSFVIYLAMLFDYDYVYLFSLVVLVSGVVAFARLYLNKHTLAQVFAGYFAGLIPLVIATIFL